jgi:ABC-2 type transport system permease protein
MNILRREWRAGFKSLAVWTASLALFNLAMMAIYPSFARDTGGLDELIELMPEGFMKAFGLDRMSLTDIMGFYATEAYIIFVLCGGIYAVLLGSSILAREENSRTIEFLLARPITRYRLLANVQVYCLCSSLSLCTVVGLVTWAAFEIFQTGPFDRHILLLLCLAPVLLQFTFIHIGLLGSVLVTRRKTITAAGIGLVLGAYFVFLLAEISEPLAMLGFLTPFKYVSAADIVTSGTIRPLWLLLLLLINGALVGASYLIYGRKDLAA